jgi:hypothetical protein
MDQAEAMVTTALMAGAQASVYAREAGVPDDAALYLAVKVALAVIFASIVLGGQ